MKTFNRQKFITTFTLIIGLFICFYCTTVNLFNTIYVDTHLSGSMENVTYIQSHWVIQILLIIILIFLLSILYPKINFTRKQINIIEIISLALFLFICLFWIFQITVKPISDSRFITGSALDFSNQSYANLEGKGYFVKYPYQLGFTTIILLISKIIGFDRYRVLMMGNAFLITIAYYFLLQITKKIFNDIKIELFTLVLLCTFLPTIFYCAFIYGVFPGFTFGLISIYFLICFVQSEKISYLIISWFTIALAIIIKPNYLIFLIAEVIYLLFSYLSLNAKKIGLTLLFIFTANLPNNFIIHYYENLIGHPLTGIPQITFIVAGAEDSPDRAQGWYNGYEDEIFVQNEMDYEKTEKATLIDLNLKLNDFFIHPQYWLDFYHSKNISQWADPSYESLWINEVRYNLGSYVEPPNQFVTNVISEDYHNGLYNFMDFHSTLLYLFATVGCLILTIGHKELQKATYLPIMIFLGGFVAQTLLEAKSQYTIIYALIIMPIAAFGLVYCIEYISSKLKLCK